MRFRVPSVSVLRYHRFPFKSPTSFHPALPWPEQLVQSLAAIRLTARVDLVGREDGDARRDCLQEGSWRERHDAGGSGGSVDSRRDPVAGCTKSSQG
jgi:hypothetical protein